MDEFELPIGAAAQGIVEDVVDQLTGKESILTRSAANYIKALEQSQQRFTAAIDAAAAKADAAARQSVVATSRLLRRAVYLATGCIVIYAAILVVVIVWHPPPLHVAVKPRYRHAISMVCYRVRLCSSMTLANCTVALSITASLSPE